jgi:hypothetical protein
VAGGAAAPASALADRAHAVVPGGAGGHRGGHAEQPAVYDDVLFSAHMVQHVLLIMVAPPLLVFGRPVMLLLHSAANPVHT